jgi:uncharacterized repeat protein (TIGR01451 family)
MLKRRLFLASFIILIFSFYEPSAQTTQITRAFGLAYSKNLRGGFVNFGNTSMHAVANGTVDLNRMNETGNPDKLGYSQYGNDFSEMRRVDVDEQILTTNSSSADLVLPAGPSTIKFARLYWSGRIDVSAVNNTPDTLRKIKIRKGVTGNYLNLTASEVLSVINPEQTSVVYQSYADITNYIQTNGEGTYTIADVPLSETDAFGGQYGGWAITVVYENPSLPYYSVRIYDGFATIYNGGNIGSLGFTLNGLNVPGAAVNPEDAVMGIISWEGDANLLQDFVKVNGNVVDNSKNPSNNFFNGSITRNDAYVTNKNPNYFNQMGVDIDEINVGVGYGIEPNAKSVDIVLGTEADQYFQGVFTFSIRVKDPTLVLEKKVSDEDNDSYVGSLEELTYTLSGSNVGKGNAYNTFIVDTIPANVTYVPSSFEVLSTPSGAIGSKTDATGDDEFFVGSFNGKTYLKWYVGEGSSAIQGGEVSVGSGYSARFKVRSLQSPSNVTNLAHVEGESIVGEIFTDESTAIIYVNYGSGIIETVTTCDAYLWRGTLYKNSGKYYYDYLNNAGLPAADTLYLTIKKSTTSLTIESICSSALPYQWNGLTFTEEGTKTVTLINAVGCDSLATLELIVKPVTSSITRISICPGLLPYRWNELIFSEAGTQSATLINAEGCDSIATLELTVIRTIESETKLTVCERLLPYEWNGLVFTEEGTKTAMLKSLEGCDSLATLTLTVINCDPPCYTENFNTNPVGWKLSRGAQIREYQNPLNTCSTDRGIQTPGVGGFDPAIIQTPQYTSTGAKRIKLSFDLYPFDANMRCNSWKDYNCPTSIDVYYYVGSVRFVGVIDYTLPKNGPGGSPNVTVIIPDVSNLSEGTKYSIEIVFKKKNGVGNCIQQNTKYVIDNFAICELQCATCPPSSSFVSSNYSYTNTSSRSQNIAIWPNPASHKVHVMTNNMAPARIELFDVLGKRVLSVVNQISIDVSQLKGGIYIAKIYKLNAEIESRQIHVIK